MAKNKSMREKASRKCDKSVDSAEADALDSSYKNTTVVVPKGSLIAGLQY